MSLTPELVWGLFPRLLGLVYLVSFASLHGQLLALAGSRGITPLTSKLEAIRRDFGRPGWVYFPTLLWLRPTDGGLRLVCGLGLAAAALAVVGGPLSPLALLACWSCYLSLDIAVDLSPPWDSLLLEAGFLALLLPPLQPLPSLEAQAAAPPALAWAYRWLLFRVILGFGKKKFLGTTRRDRSYLKDFLINQILPTPLGWRAHHLPAPLFRVGLVALFVVEVVAPPFLFVPGWPRLAAGVAIALLMVAIWATGNFGFFSPLVIALCVPLLDAQATLLDAATAGPATWRHGAANLLAPILLVGGLLGLPFDTWCARSWIHWPGAVAARPRLLRWLLCGLRSLAPFRVLHAYGVFPPHGSPPLRWVPVLEGTGDGSTWHEYGYRFLPSREASPPRFLAPHQARLDHLLFYEALGMYTPLLASAVQGHDPYACTRSPPLERLLQRLLEGGSSAAGLFGHNPFPDPDRPPVALRVRLCCLWPTTSAQRAASGRWWHRRDLGAHTGPRRLDPGVWRRWLPGPLAFHADAVAWRRRAPSTRALGPATAGTDAATALRAMRPKLTVADLDAFWDDVEAHPAPPDWTGLREAARRFADRRDEPTRERCACALSCCSRLLLERLEPHFLGPRTPRIAAASYFHLWLLCTHIVGRGRRAFEAALVDPTVAAAAAAEVTPESGLYLTALLDCEAVAFHARKARLLTCIGAVEPGRGLVGALDLVPFLARQLVDADERPPAVARTLDGDWLVVEEEAGPCRG